MANYKTVKDIESKTWDAIIIGSGMGGLTTAAALSRTGMRCLVIEQHYVPGGFTHDFQRKGFTWDVGVHAVGALAPNRQLRNMFDYISEDRLKWEFFGDTYETFRFPGNEKFVFPSDKKKFRQAMEDYFPNEKESIRKYFQYIDQAAKEMSFYYLAKAMPTPVMKFMNATGSGGKKWRAKLTEDVLNELNLSEKCRAVLVSQWGYYGDVPKDSSFAMQAMVVKHFQYGAYYPIGGSSMIAKEIIETIRKTGGDVVVRSAVKELILENGKCVGVKANHRDGTYELRSPIVLSAISALSLVRHLIPESYQQIPWAQELKSFHQTPPHVCLYIGFEGDVEKAGATHSSQWVNQTWNMNQKYWNCEDPKARPPILFVSFPSIKDPAHDPTEMKKHTGEVVTFVNFELFKKWQDSKRGKRPEEYDELKKNIEERILAEFKEAFPELAKLIVYHELSTPLSTTFYVDTPEGAIYGLEHTPKRFLSAHLQTRTPIPGLYMSASDVATGGVAGAMTGGMLAAATIKPKLFLKML